MPKFNSISGKILRRLGIHLPVAWEDAQEFEFAHTVEYMKTDTFEDKLEAANSEECAISKGYVHPGILGEYFSGETRDWAEFVKFIDGKTVMEIGPSVASVICQWDVAAKRIIIDPLLDKVRPYQEETFGRTGFTNTIGYSIPAEQRIEELVGQIDGALFIRNCLDHSP